MFRDRIDAGEQLAQALEAYRNQGALVLAIPRGGIIVGVEIALALCADFAVVVSRKLPFPHSPESGFGAIAEDGSLYLFEECRQLLPPQTVSEIVEAQKRVIDERIRVLRHGRPLPEISGRTVILVDDGIAMGSTVRAALLLCRKKNAAKIVVASPVAGASVAREMAQLADEAVILESPRGFMAVAEVYEEWYDVPDEEALRAMKRLARASA